MTSVCKVLILTNLRIHIKLLKFQKSKQNTVISFCILDKVPLTECFFFEALFTLQWERR